MTRIAKVIKLQGNCDAKGRMKKEQLKINRREAKSRLKYAILTTVRLLTKQDN